MKSLLLQAFGDSLQNEGLKNSLEDLIIPLHGHEMATGLAIRVDRCTFIKSRKV
jgi:hypothetical protein